MIEQKEKKIRISIVKLMRSIIKIGEFQRVLNNMLIKTKINWLHLS
jgi:hypothetical protein